MDVREKLSNEKRLIDADAFLEKMKRTSRYFDVVFDVEEMPTVDAVLVRHGLWIEDHDYLKCPECGAMVKRDFTFFDIGDWNFCPNCGTNLDLEE